MESGSTPVDELVAMLEAADVVDVRMALYRATEEDGGGWRVGFGEVLLGAAAAAAERTWTYRDDVFVQRRLPGQVAADLVREKPQQVAGLQVSAATTPPTCIFQRLAGQVRYNQAALPWPRTVWQLNRQDQLSSRSRATLVGDGPAFLHADAAFAAFFHQAAAENGLAQPHELWQIVRLDRRGWIHRVVIGPDALTVTVKGTALAGTKVELTTPDSHQIRPVGTTGKVRLKLPRGLVAGTLLMLRTGDDWLDFRYFPATGTGGGDTSVVWDLPGADAEVLIAGGETEYVEFKREVPAAESSRKKILKTVAAFASGQGGTVLIGVEDDAQVVGVDATNLDELMRTVRSMIRDRIEPDPPVTVRAVPVNGKTVLLIEVAAGGRMFGYDREKPEFYLRRGASTRPARMREIDVGFGASSPQLW